MLTGVGVSCRISYSTVSHLYVRFSRLITSVGDERAYFSALAIMWFLYGVVSSLPLGAWHRLHYFIVVIPWPSI